MAFNKADLPAEVSLISEAIVEVSDGQWRLDINLQQIGILNSSFDLIYKIKDSSTETEFMRYTITVSTCDCVTSFNGGTDTSESVSVTFDAVTAVSVTAEWPTCCSSFFKASYGNGALPAEVS